MKPDLLKRCKEVLRANDHGAYTVPSPELYPYQWNWDAGFIALGWATFDEKRAWLELETLLTAQWQDGMLPHIVFHQESPDYFPGPGVWGVPESRLGSMPSSGITQPPILATVVRQLVENAKDEVLAKEKAEALVPKILEFHRWLYKARDPDNTGLVALLHPWESGMDNSPLWDKALESAPRVSLPSERRDTGHVNAEQRPQTEEYERYIGLINLFREHDYEPGVIYRNSPFKVVDVAFNAILHRANRDLLELATRFDLETGEIEDWLDLGKAALQSLWDEEDAFFYSLDLISGEPIKIRTSGSLTPIYAGVATDEQTRTLLHVLETWNGGVRYLVPSTSPSETAFEAKRYWRGPVWMNVNWLLYQGLIEYGFLVWAQKIKEDSLALAEQFGIYEYYDPNTGEGLGGHTFAWTAALMLAWQS